jgi:hypothetical protein
MFVTKLKERVDKNGNTYLIGSLGLVRVTLRRNKTNQDEWNMMFDEESAEWREKKKQFQQNRQGVSSELPDDEIPF